MTPTWPHTQAILAVLDDAGIRTGDHQAPLVDPSDPQSRPVGQCAVVYMVGGPILGQTLDAIDDAGLVRFRIITVDDTPAGASDLADLVQETLTDAVVEVEDRSVCRIRCDGLGIVTRDPDLTPPMFYSSTGYRMISVADPSDS